MVLYSIVHIMHLRSRYYCSTVRIRTYRTAPHTLSFLHLVTKITTKGTAWPLFRVERSVSSSIKRKTIIRESKAFVDVPNMARPSFTKQPTRNEFRWPQTTTVVRQHEDAESCLLAPTASTKWGGELPVFGLAAGTANSRKTTEKVDCPSAITQYIGSPMGPCF